MRQARGLPLVLSRSQQAVLAGLAGRAPRRQAGTGGLGAAASPSSACLPCASCPTRRLPHPPTPPRSFNGVDNGFLSFDHLRVGRDAMLMRFAQVTEDGRYVPPPPDNQKAAYATMVYVRATIVRDSGDYLSELFPWLAGWLGGGAGHGWGGRAQLAGRYRRRRRCRLLAGLVQEPMSLPAHASNLARCIHAPTRPPCDRPRRHDCHALLRGAPPDGHQAGGARGAGEAGGRWVRVVGVGRGGVGVQHAVCGGSVRGQVSARRPCSPT